MIGRTDTSYLATWLRQTDMVVLLLFLVLFATGVTIINSISPAMAARIGVNDYFFLYRHLKVVPVAIFTMLFISTLNHKTIIYGGMLIAMPILLVLLGVTLVYGDEIKGAQRWLYIYGISIQISELIKPALILTVGCLLAGERSSYRIPGTWITILISIYTVGVLYFQPDIGQSILILGIVYVQMFVAGTAFRMIYLFPVILLLYFAFSYLMFPHVAERILSFIHFGGDLGYQLDQAKNAIMNGGWLGTGLGMGQVKHLLPDAHTDFVLAVMIEELGGIFVILTTVIIATISGIAVWRSIISLDLTQQVIVSGVITHLVGQTLINAGSMLQIIPTTGMTVPFISYGGSSLVSSAASAGLLLAFCRKGRWTRKAKS